MYYLYIKKHNLTGLRYLGYTSKKNYHTYPGSGHYWRRHLGAHGYDYTTTVLLATESKEEIKETGRFFSNLFNIVESKSWANLKPEEGMGGTHTVSEEQKKKQSKKMKGRYIGENNPMYGQKRSDTTERNSLPKKWVTNGVEDKLILKEQLTNYLSIGYNVGRSNSRNKGSKINYSTIICEGCSKGIRPVNYKRHLQKCLKRN